MNAARDSLRLLAIIAVLMVAGYFAAHEQCEIPAGQSCSTDMECACLHGEEVP